MSGVQRLTFIRKAVAAFTVLPLLTAGGVGLGLLFVSLVQWSGVAVGAWPTFGPKGQKLGWLEAMAFIIGASIGAGVGVTIWALIVTWLGWFTWSEVEYLVDNRRDR